MKRRIISLFVAMLVVLAMPMQVLAAEHTVTTNAEANDALRNDSDAQVTVNLNNSEVDWQLGFAAKEGQNYTINGNGNDVTSLMVDGSGDVTVNANIVGDADAYVEIHGSDVTINGDVAIADSTGNYTGYVTVMDGSLTIDGNVDCETNINAKDSQLEITGNATAGMGVDVNGSDVTVGGDLTADGTILVVNSGALTVEDGDVSAAEVVMQNGELTVDGNVTANSGLYVERGSNADIDGNVTTNDAENGILVYDSELTVSGSINGEGGLEASNSSVEVGTDVDRTYVTAYNGGELTVGGDASAEMGINVGEESKIEIDGNIDSTNVNAMNGEITVGGDVNVVETVYANNSTVEIEGDVTSEVSNAILASNGSNVTIDGDVTSETSNGVQAINGSTVTIGGDVVAGSGVFTDDEGVTHAFGGAGIVAIDSNVTVEGNVTGGSVTADNVTGSKEGGAGVAVVGSSIVEVAGNVTGGDATMKDGVGAPAVYYEESSIPFTGSVTVGGTMTDGKSEIKEEEPAPTTPEPVVIPVEEPTVEITVGEAPALEELTVTISEAKDEVVIEELKEEELDNFLETLKETVKESTSDTVTINVSAHKEVSSVRIPTEILKAIIETFGKLEIVFEDGTIIIDAAEFEKMIAELGFFIIKLK